MTVEKLAQEIFDECEKEGEPVTKEEALTMAEQEIGAKGIKVGAKADNPKKKKKPKTVNVSREKREIFAEIVEFLQIVYDIEIEKENKLIKIIKDDKIFKLDLIETRPKK